MCVVAGVLAICYMIIFSGSKDNIFVKDYMINMYYPTMIAIGVFFVDYITRRCMRASLLSNKGSFLMLISSSIQLILTIVVLGMLYVVERIFKIELFLPIWACELFYVFVAIIIKGLIMMYRNRRYKSISKYKISLADENTPFKLDLKIHSIEEKKEYFIGKYIFKNKKYSEQGVYYPFMDYIFSQKRRIYDENKSEIGLFLLLLIAEGLFCSILSKNEYITLQIEESEVRFMIYIVLAGIIVDFLGIVINYIDLRILNQLDRIPQDEIDEIIEKIQYKKEIDEVLSQGKEESIITSSTRKNKDIEKDIENNNIENNSIENNSIENIDIENNNIENNNIENNSIENNSIENYNIKNDIESNIKEDNDKKAEIKENNTNEDHTNNSDVKEKNTKEADIKEIVTNEDEIKEENTKEIEAYEAEIKEVNTKEIDTQEENAKEAKDIKDIGDIKETEYIKDNIIIVDNNPTEKL